MIVAIFSEDTLHDIIAALGIMIYWYYGITRGPCYIPALIAEE